MTFEIPKCTGCGQFIAAAELDKCKMEFTPDSEFTTEEILWTCPKCVTKEIEEKNKQ